MDVRTFIGGLSTALLRRPATMPPIPVRVIRASLAEVPLRPRPRPPHRPAPPIRPASNM
ncbi:MULTISPECIES: hypothetical protein [unclassified Mesorhizobium]|uniref:hypothetical protein n=1 Tax=unclassified Mesorhizobium TaxID=325217 RepID=UPI00142EF0C5|nr:MULTISPECIES: hypothetical protein [unclassified Mesorhizobium]